MDAITGHEEEMAYLREWESSAEARALAIQGAGDTIARNGAVLERAARGTLTDYVDLFGETVTVAEQIAIAESEIASARDRLFTLREPISG